MISIHKCHPQHKLNKILTILKFFKDSVLHFKLLVNIFPTQCNWLYSLWFQYSWISKILHHILKLNLISVNNKNYNKLNQLWSKQLSFPNYPWNLLELWLASNAWHNSHTQCFLFAYYTKLNKKFKFIPKFLYEVINVGSSGLRIIKKGGLN